MGQCALWNPLLKDHPRGQLRKEIRKFKSNRQRERYYINLLQSLQPPKVSGKQIENYFAFKRGTGVDVDKKIIFTKVDNILPPSIMINNGKILR